MTSETAIYVCDTLGELSLWYEIAGIAFVGGSLVPLGGHNMLEAARVPSGCVVIHGPFGESNGAGRELLASTDPPAARCVHDAEALAVEVHRLLASSQALRDARAAARRVALELEHGKLDRIWIELEDSMSFPGR